MNPFPFSRFIVSDRSMEPTYFEGDHVLTFNWISPGVGKVVVYFDAEYFIKRIKSLNGNQIKVVGDNVKMSAKMKPIKKDQIVGVVILKY